MRFALMQKELAALDEERLRRSLRGQAGLVAADAPKIAANAMGVVLKGLVFNDALALQQAFGAEGVETVVVAEGDLPTVPLARAIKTLACGAEALTVRDSLNRDLKVDYARIKMVAAGWVKISEFTRVRTETEPKQEGDHGVKDALIFGAIMTASLMAGVVHIPASNRKQSVVSYYSVEASSQQPVLAIITDDAVGHYALEGEHVQNSVKTAAWNTGNAGADFITLVAELAGKTPQAQMNLGADYMRKNGTGVCYPNRGAFQHEMIWRFWHAQEFGLEQR